MRWCFRARRAMTAARSRGAPRSRRAPTARCTASSSITATSTRAGAAPAEIDAADARRPARKTHRPPGRSTISLVSLLR